MAEVVLGLDLGPNSIGWALVQDSRDVPSERKLIASGVRVFPEGVAQFDTSKEVSRNEKRRIARGMRRQTLRRSRRKKQLTQALISAGLWPQQPEQQQMLYRLDPYDLRSRAITEELSPHEIGRIFIHLNQRRGFLSNRKKDRGDNEVKGMLAEINTNEADRIESGAETIGQWLGEKQAKLDHASRQENDHIRKRHLSRAQYADEFDAIWRAQATHHPTLLTEQLRYGSEGASSHSYPKVPKQKQYGQSALMSFGLQGMMYFQRPMYWPASVIGLCELEPKKKRAPLSDRRYHRFRLLQEVNNLRYVDPDKHEQAKLSDQQRTLLLDKLRRRKEMTFDQIRGALGFLESVKFNLERGKRSKIKGMPIDALLASRSVLGPTWYDRPDQQRTEIVAALLDHERDDDAMVAHAIEHWDMTEAEIDAALCVDFPAGFGNLSIVALEKLLPHMENGMLYMANDDNDSALHAAGYLRRDQLQRRIFDRLPDPKRTKDCPIGDIPNPVVKRTLTEVRRVVNAILREHGKPDAIHVEMARTVQQGKNARNETTKRMRDNEKQRSDAAKRLTEHGVRVTRDNILKLRLWEQQRHECIYSGAVISIEKLFGDGGGVEVDHILPYSRTLDDSQANKVVCLRDSNQDKANQTPYEWLADTKPDRYAEICQRAGNMMRGGDISYGKYQRFIKKELELDQFIARQLTDTGYITRATAEYLRCLFDGDHYVLGLKGQLTSELRWQWGLDTVLQELPDSPGWQDVKANRLRPGEKNRSDHRHHAIDAIVVALTNRSRLKQLSQIVRKGGAKTHGEVLESPWDNFRNSISDAISQVVVSHRVDRKVAGGLHEETLYGKTDDPGVWAVRKDVTTLSATEVGRIRDDHIKKIVINKLAEHGIEIGGETKPAAKDVKRFKEILSGLTMPSGVPIKKVRIEKKDQTIQPIREGGGDQAFVKPGSTHHICIFQWKDKGKTKRAGVFVTMLEAANRLKQRQPIIERKPPANHPKVPPNATFIMSLSQGEMVMARWKGETRYLVLRTSTSTEDKLFFSLHSDARRRAEYEKYRATTNRLDAAKITVTPTGEIRWAND